MRPLLWLVAVAGLTLVAGAALAAPVVTNSLPQEDEVVPAGKVHVELEFSEPMKDGAWSIVAADRGEVPKIVEGPEYITPQILIMEVMTEPGKLYGIGFNSATKRNFASMQGEPLKPFTIHFRTAGGAADEEGTGGDPVEADDTPGVNQPVEDDGGDAPPPDTRADQGKRRDLTPVWRLGETQERTVTLQRIMDTNKGDAASRTYTKVARTSALQIISLKDGHITRARGQMVKAERNREGTGEDDVVMEPMPVPRVVLEAWIQNGKWAAGAKGGQVPPSVLQAFVDTVATGNPFAPSGPVAQGQEWKLSGAALRSALDLLSSEQKPTGTVTCTLASVGSIKTRDGKTLAVANITHEWTAEIVAENLAVRLQGRGKTVFLLDGGKYISTEVELSGPATQLEPAAGDEPQTGGVAQLLITQRLRYFAKGQYPELTAEEGTETGTVGTDEGGALTLNLGGDDNQGGEPSLVGLWIVKTPEFALVLDVKPDGTYHRMVGSAEGNEEDDGTYRTGPGWLEIKPKGDETLRLKLKFVDANTVEITDDESNGFRLVRQNLEGGGDGQAPPDNGGAVPPDNGGGMGPDDDPWAEFGGDGEGGDMGPAPDDGQAPPDDGGGAPPNNGGGTGPDDDPWGMF